MKKTLSFIALSLALGGVSSAAVYTTTFNSFTYGAGLGGQDGWAVTGAPGDNTGPTQIGTSPFPTPATSGGRAVLFGASDLDPTSTSAYAYHNYNLPLVGADVTTTFHVAMTIQDSDPTFPNRDSFGFTLRDSSDTNLFTINFTPTAQAPGGDPTTSTRVDNVSWSSGAFSSAPIATLTEGQWTTIDLTFVQIPSTSDAQFNLSSAGVSIASGTLTGFAAANVATFGAVANAYSGNSLGNNMLIFDDISLVPEPSAALLGMLGASFALVRRRRA